MRRKEAVVARSSFAKNLDDGRPDRNFSKNPALAEALDALATNLANRISIASLSDGTSRPSLEIN